MARVLSLTWKIAAWTSFLVGLLWSGKVDLPETSEEKSEPIRVTVSVESPGEYPLAIPESSSAISVDVVLALADRDILRFEEWLKTSPDVTIDIRDKGGIGVIRFGGDAFKAHASRSLDEFSIVSVARGEIPADRLPLEGQVVATGRDRLFYARGSAVEFGGLPVEQVFRYRPMRPTFRQAAPGLVLLVGAMGIFVQLFMIWARFIIPVRPALPDLGPV